LFVAFSNVLRVKGIYQKSGVAEIRSIPLNQTVRVKNTGDQEGIFFIERVFPGVRSGYYLNNSPNIQTVVIGAGEEVNVSFEQGVLCHRIGAGSGEIDLMDYFIEHNKVVRDQKDYIIQQVDENILACERGHYRVFAPLVEFEVEEEFEETAIINEQGTDTFRPTKRCK
jgi:hypothetical protein